MLLTDADQLREALAMTLQELDEARAEVERLRKAKHTSGCRQQSAHNAECVCGADEAQRDLLRFVAERQREACVACLRNRLKEANEDRLSVDYVRGLRAAVVYADSTPLVTEGGK